MFKARFRIIIAMFAAAMCVALPLVAGAMPSVAVLTPENRSTDPRYDYIGGIAYGLLLYDLSSSGSVELVDRSAMEALLSERELSLSAIAATPGTPFEGLEGADWVLAGEYVLLGQDVRLTLKLVDVATSRTTTFSDVGSTENLVHSLAEAVVEKLSGKRPQLQEEGRSRSILSLRDETPGTIALFSYLVDAEVFLDGEFVGYTTGDRRVPFVIDSVGPGVHTVSTDLGADFGVIILPEVRFAPWSEVVRIQSGKRLTVTDKSTHFNDQLYRLQRVVRESPKVVFDAAGVYVVSFPVAFTDRDGVARSGSVSVELRPVSGESGKGSGTAVFGYEGQSVSMPFEYPADAETEIEHTIGLAEFSVAVDGRYARVGLDIEVGRTDIHQGMHRGE